MISPPHDDRPVRGSHHLRPAGKLLILALLVVTLAAGLGPTRIFYLDFLRQGDDHARRAERTAAVEAYRAATRLKPSEPAPYLRLARVYLEWGKTDEALNALSTAEELGVTETDAVHLERLWIGAHAARSDWPAVLEHAQAALALLPDDPVARHALARAYVEMQQWDGARAEYTAMLRADPADAVAHERLGALLAGDDPMAVQHLLAASTDLAGGLLAALQESAAADDPAYTAALVGRVLFEEAEWALAVRHFGRAVQHNPQYADAHAYLGCALTWLDRPVEAGTHLRQAVSLAPDSVVARIFMGMYYERQGDLAAARREYEAAYDIDPENPAVCVEIGQTWAAERRYVAAEIWLLEAVSLEPGDAALWEILARFYLEHTITAQGAGVAAAERMLELAPEDARAHDLRGWAALQVGDTDTAHDSLHRAISLDPTLASAYYHLGLLWSAQGQDREAREAFVRALDLDTTGEITPLVVQIMAD